MGISWLRNGPFPILVVAVLLADAGSGTVAAAPLQPSVSQQRPPAAAAPGTSARPQELVHAQGLLTAGATTEAIAVLRELAQRLPDDGETHLLLGKALALVPEPASALAALRRAIELQPESSDAHTALGMALARFGDADAARLAFERVVALNPRAADARVHLALALAQLQQLDAARAHLVTALDLLGEAPAAAYPHYLMAQIVRETGDTDAALQHLAKAIERRPDYAEAHFTRGLILSQLREDAGALEAFRAAVRLAPDDGVSRGRLGAAYLRAGQPAEAIPHLQYALQAHEDRATFYHLCRALQLSGRRGDAARCTQDFAARFASDSGEHDLDAARANNEGVALEASGDVAAALERYRTAVTLIPSNTVFRRNLAIALCRLGQWDEGIRELRTVLEVNPNDADATRALYVAVEQVRSKTARTPD